MSSLHRFLLYSGGGIVAGCLACTRHQIRSDATTTQAEQQSSWLRHLWFRGATTQGAPSCLPCSARDVPGRVVVWGGRFGKTATTLPQLGNSITQVAVGDGFGAAVDASGNTVAFHIDAAGATHVHTLRIRNVTSLAIREAPREIVLLDAHGQVHRARLRGDQGRVEGTVALEGVLKRARVTGVACGKGHCVGVTQTGRAASWGLAQDGRLGRETDGQDEAETPAWMQIPGGKHVVQAACGDAHTLLRGVDGDVFAAGRDEWAQLGVSSEPWRATHAKIVATPRKCGLLDGVVACDIAGGGQHSVVLAADGTVFSAGFNQSGQLGHHNYASFAPPAAVADVRLRVARVHAGARHTVVLDVHGDVWCIGGNERGQLGNGRRGASMKWKRVRVGDVEGGGSGRKKGKGIRACRVSVLGDANAVIVVEEEEEGG